MTHALIYGLLNAKERAAADRLRSEAYDGKVTSDNIASDAFILADALLRLIGPGDGLHKPAMPSSGSTLE